MPGTVQRTAPQGKTLVLCEPPFLFWDRSMDRLRQDEETIPGMGVLVLAAAAGVPGLAYRDAGRVHANARAPYIDDLDSIPHPAWDLLPDFPHRFQPSLFSYPCTPVATVITSRGCPFSCSFCDRSTSGKKGRMHSVEYVVGLCRHLVGLGVRHIIFVDDLFTVRRQRVVDMCQAFLDEGFTFSWSCNSHPNLLDFQT